MFPLKNDKGGAGYTPPSFTPPKTITPPPPKESGVVVDYTGVGKKTPGNELSVYDIAIQNKIDAHKSFDEFMSYFNQKPQGGILELKASPEQLSDPLYMGRLENLKKQKVKAEAAELEARKIVQPLIDKFYEEAGVTNVKDMSFTTKDKYGNVIPDEGLIFKKVNEFVKSHGGGGNVANILAADIVSRVNQNIIDPEFNKEYEKQVKELEKSGQALFPTEKGRNQAVKDITRYLNEGATAMKVVTESEFKSFVEKKKAEYKPILDDMMSRYGKIKSDMHQSMVNDLQVEAQFSIDTFKEELEREVANGTLLVGSANFRLKKFVSDTYEALNNKLTSQEFTNKVEEAFGAVYGPEMQKELDTVNEKYTSEVGEKAKKLEKVLQRGIQELNNIGDVSIKKLNSLTGLSKEAEAQLLDIANKAYGNVLLARNKKMSDQVEKTYRKSMMDVTYRPLNALADIPKFFGDSFWANVGNMMKSKAMALNAAGYDGQFVDWLKEAGGSMYSDKFTFTPELKSWNFISPAFIGNSMGQLAYSVPSILSTAVLSRVGIPVANSNLFALFQTADNAALNSGDTYWQWLQQNPGDVSGAQQAAEKVFKAHMLDLPLNAIIGKFWFGKNKTFTSLGAASSSEYVTESYESATQSAVLNPDTGNFVKDAWRYWKGKQAQTEGVMAAFGVMTTGAGSMMANATSDAIFGKARPDVQFLANMIFDRTTDFAKASFVGMENQFKPAQMEWINSTIDRVGETIADAKALGLDKGKTLLYVEMSERIHEERQKADKVKNPAMKEQILGVVKTMEQELMKIADGTTEPVILNVGGTSVAVTPEDAEQLLDDEAVKATVGEGVVTVSSTDEKINKKVEEAMVAATTPENSDVAITEKEESNEGKEEGQETLLSAGVADNSKAVAEPQPGKVNEESTTTGVDNSKALGDQEAAAVADQDKDVKRKAFNQKFNEDMGIVGKGVIPGSKTVSNMSPEGKKKKLDAMTKRLIEAKNEGIIDDNEFNSKYNDVAKEYQKLAEKNPEYKEAAKAATTKAKEAVMNTRVNVSAFAKGDKVSVTIDDVDSLDENAFTGVQRKIVRDAKNVTKAISRLVSSGTGNKMTVTLHNNEESFGDAVIQAGGKAQEASLSKGFYLGSDGSIHINMAKATSETMLHEGFHPVLDYIEQNNPEKIDQLYNQLATSAEGKKFIASNKRRYSGERAQKKEAITDFVAHVADGRVEVNATNFQRIKNMILGWLKKLGFDVTVKRIADMSNAEDLKNLAQFITERFTKGEAIDGTLDPESGIQFSRQEAKTDDNPVFFENIKDFANKSSFKNKLEFKKAVQEISNKYLPELRKKYGKDFNPSVYNESTRKYLSDILTKEAFNAIDAHPEAIGWYDQKTVDALSAISAIHPEITTDMEARGAFILPLAVMSNGNKVDKNFELAEKQYEHYKRTGRFNPNGNFGAQQVGIKKSLKLVNALLDQGVTMKEINNFFTSQHLAGDLKFRKPDGTLGSLVSGELANEKVFGAVVLGPKIGNGFYMNLWGEFGQLTMDRWFMRTWGRLTGTLIKDNKEAVDNGKKELKSLLEQIKSDKALAKTLKDIIGPFAGKPMPAVAFAIEKASADKNARNILSSHPLTDELRKLGNTLSKNIRGEKEAPGNGEERRFIREVFADVKSRLTSEYGIDITMADLQAVLWYPEKILYESFKEGESFEDASEGYTEDSAPDYFNSARKLAQKLGATDEQINQAVSDGRRNSEGRIRGGDSTSGGTVSDSDQRVLGEIRKARGGAAELQKGRVAPQFSLADTNTDAFRNWFGNSKVVDESGKPLEVFHGTGTVIEAFNPEFTGKGNDQYGSGFYFTTDITEAEGYQGRTVDGKDKLGGTDNPNVVSAYLKIEKPINVKGASLNDADVELTRFQAQKIIEMAPGIMDPDETPLWNWYDLSRTGGPSKALIAKVAANYDGGSLMTIENDFFRGNATAFREAVNKATGFDGVIQTYENGKKHFVAWFPNQIKSTTNVGTFDPNDNRIQFSLSTTKNNKTSFSVVSDDVASELSNSPFDKERNRRLVKSFAAKDGKRYIVDGSRIPKVRVFNDKLKQVAVAVFDDSKAYVGKGGYFTGYEFNESIKVNKGYRRLGIASAMIDHAENIFGVPYRPSRVLTADMEGFVKNRFQIADNNNRIQFSLSDQIIFDDAITEAARMIEGGSTLEDAEAAAVEYAKANMSGNYTDKELKDTVRQYMMDYGLAPRPGDSPKSSINDRMKSKKEQKPMTLRQLFAQVYSREKKTLEAIREMQKEVAKYLQANAIDLSPDLVAEIMNQVADLVKPDITIEDIDKVLGTIDDAIKVQTNVNYRKAQESFGQQLIDMAIAMENVAEGIKEIQNFVTNHFKQVGIDMKRSGVVNLMKQLARLAEAGESSSTLFDVLNSIDSIIAEQQRFNEIQEARTVSKKFKKFVKASRYLSIDHRQRLNEILAKVKALNPNLMAQVGVDMKEFVDTLNTIMSQYGPRQGVRELTMDNLEYMSSKLDGISKDIADYLDAKSLLRYNAERDAAQKKYDRAMKKYLAGGAKLAAMGGSKAIPNTIPPFYFPSYDEWMEAREDAAAFAELEAKIAGSETKGVASDKTKAIARLQVERLQEYVKDNAEYLDDYFTGLANRIIGTDLDLVKDDDAKMLVSLINNMINDGNTQGVQRFLAYQDAKAEAKELADNPMRINNSFWNPANGFSLLLASMTFNKEDAARLRELFLGVMSAANKVQRMMYGFVRSDGKGVIEEVYDIARKMASKPLSNARVGVFQFLNQSEERPATSGTQYTPGQIEQRVGMQEYTAPDSVVSKQQDFEYRLDHLIDASVERQYNEAAANERAGGVTSQSMMREALATADALKQMGLIEGYDISTDQFGNKTLEVRRKDDVTLDGLYDQLDANEKELYNYIREKFGDVEFLEKMKQVSEGLHNMPFNAIANYAPMIARRFKSNKGKASDMITEIGNMNFRGEGGRRVGVRPSDRFMQRGVLANPAEFYYSMDAIGNFLSAYYESNLAIEGGEQLKSLAYLLNSDEFRNMLNGVYNKVIDGQDIRFEMDDENKSQYNKMLERFAEVLQETTSPPFLSKDPRGWFQKTFEYVLGGMTATMLQTSDQIFKQLGPNLAAGIAATGMPETLMATRVLLHYTMAGTPEDRSKFVEFLKNFEGDFRSPMGEAAFDELNDLMNDYDKIYKAALNATRFKDTWTPARIGKWIFKKSDKAAYSINVIAAYISAEIKAGRLDSAWSFDTDAMENVNQRSVAEALNIAEMLNNASKSSERAPYSKMRTKDKSIGDQVFRNVMFLKGFAMNSLMGFLINMRIATNSRGRATAQEKKEASMRALSYAVQIGTFNFMKAYVINEGFNLLGDVLVKQIFGLEGGAESEEQKRKRIKKKAAQFAATSAADFLLGWMPAPAEGLVKGAANGLWDLSNEKVFDFLKSHPELSEGLIGVTIPSNLKYEDKAAKKLVKGTILDPRYVPYFGASGGNTGSAEVYGDLAKTFMEAFKTRTNKAYTDEQNAALDKLDWATIAATVSGQGDFLKIIYGMERTIKRQAELNQPKSRGTSSPMKKLQNDLKKSMKVDLNLKIKGL